MNYISPRKFLTIHLFIILIGCNAPQITNSTRSAGSNDLSTGKNPDSKGSLPSEPDSNDPSNNPNGSDESKIKSCNESAATIEAKKAEALNETQKSFQAALQSRGLSLVNLMAISVSNGGLIGSPIKTTFPWNDYCKIDTSWDGASPCGQPVLVSGEWLQADSVYRFENGGKRFYFLIGPTLSSCASYEFVSNSSGNIYRLMRNAQRKSIGQFVSTCSCTCPTYDCGGAFLGSGVKLYALGDSDTFKGEQVIEYQESLVDVTYQDQCSCNPPP